MTLRRHMETVKGQLIARERKSLRPRPLTAARGAPAAYPNLPHPTQRPGHLQEGSEAPSTACPAQGRHTGTGSAPLRLHQAAHEGKLLHFCSRTEGGSIMSCDRKAMRKLLGSSSYKSPLEKHLPSPRAVQYEAIRANI